MVDGVMKRSFFFRNDKFYSPDRLDQAFDEVWTAVNFVVGQSGLSVALIQETVGAAVERKLSSVRHVPVNVTLNDVSGLSERLVALERAVVAPASASSVAVSTPAYDDSKIMARLAAVERLAATSVPAPVAAVYDDTKILARMDLIERRLTELHNAVTGHVTNPDLHAVSTGDLATVSSGLLNLDTRLKETETVLTRLKEMVS